jgi:hypothetical protein
LVLELCISFGFRILCFFCKPPAVWGEGSKSEIRRNAQRLEEEMLKTGRRLQGIRAACDQVD